MGKNKKNPPDLDDFTGVLYQIFIGKLVLLLHSHYQKEMTRGAEGLESLIGG